MKKSLVLVAVAAAFMFTSCGGVSVCDCVKSFDEMNKEMEAAGGDQAKFKEIEAKYKSKEEACTKLMDSVDKNDEAAAEKMMKEMESCK